MPKSQTNDRGVTMGLYIMSSGDSPTPSGGSPTETELKWICPYCQESKVDQYAEVADGEREALAMLRSHIGGAAGDGHGPRNEIPVDRERTLFGYVRRADGSR